jgi:hypothetical protein
MVIPKLRSSEQLRPLHQLILELGPFKTLDETKKEIENKIGAFYEKETIFTEGILGFHRFFQGYYLTYIKDSQPIAKLGRNLCLS